MVGHRRVWGVVLVSIFIAQIASFGISTNSVSEFLNPIPEAFGQACIAPPSGLVSWWPGDGNANDIQDNNPGTLQNGATFAAGKVGQAFSLDGVNDIVEIPDSPSLTPSSITLDAWVKPTTFDGTIISKYDSNNPSNGVSWILLSVGGGKLSFGVTQNAANTIFRGIDTNNVVLTAGVFQHVAATFDSSTQAMKIYVNGVEVPSTLNPGSSTVSSIYDGNSPVRIGAFFASGSFVGLAHFWNGLVDEAEFFNRALTASEIQSIFNAGSAGKCKPAQECTPPPPNMVSWWPGDGNADDIIDANNGALQGGATFATGKVGQAFSFDGSGGVLTTANTNLNAPKQFTIDAWIKPTQLATQNDIHIIVNKENPSRSPTQYEIGVSPGLGQIPAGNLAIFTGAGGLPDHYVGWTDGGGPVPLNQFTHVTLVVNFDIGKVTTYINGQVAKEYVVSTGLSVPTVQDAPLRIGFRVLTPPVGAFVGAIDEVEFFNRALTASEIQTIFNAGSAGKCKPCTPPPPNMVSWWPGDNNANDIQDANHGTLQNGATFAAGKVGQAFSFDGVDDHVSVAHNSNLNPVAGQGWTVDAWVNPSVLNNFHVIAHKGNSFGAESTTENWAFFIRPETPHVLGFQVVKNGAVDQVHSSSGLVSGVWQHVAIVVNSIGGDATGYTFYINGIDAGRTIITDHSPGSITTTEPLRIGVAKEFSGSLVGTLFNGQIDELEIYNRALTQSEIQAIVNAGSAGKCVAPALTPAGNQNADEGANVAFELGSFADPGADSPWQVVVTWGDGSAATSFTRTSAGALPATAHTYDDNGLYTVTVRVTDADELSDTESFQVVVANVAPMATFNAPASVDEGSAFELSLTGPTDPSSADTAAGFTYAFDCGSGFGPFSPANATSCPTSDNGARSVGGKIRDKDGGVTTYAASTQVNNVNPSVNAGSDGMINEADTFNSSGSFTDAGADSWTGTVDYGDGTGTQPLALNPDKTFSLSHTYDDNGLYTVTVTITDDDGGIGTDTAVVTVNNLPPIVGPITAPINPVAVGTSVTTSAPFTDPGTADTHTASVNWGDGTISPATVAESGGSGTVTGGHTYTAAGVYTLILTVCDDDSGCGQSIFQFVVIYDLSGGFVTGGGWIDSPPGAYTPDPTLTGKATFGFVSKYLPGATTPSGNTEFQFKVANLNFKSTNYEWLVVAGAKAQYKGTGTINGAGNYGFILAAIDADINLSDSHTADKFRIKIWDKATDIIVYDNQLGAAEDADPTTTIGAGSIKIHKS